MYFFFKFSLFKIKETFIITVRLYIKSTFSLLQRVLVEVYLSNQAIVLLLLSGFGTLVVIGRIRIQIQRNLIHWQHNVVSKHK